MFGHLSNQFGDLIPFSLGARLVQGYDVALSLLGITSLAARVSCLSGANHGDQWMGTGKQGHILTAMV